MDHEEKQLLRRMVHIHEHMLWFLAVIAENQQGLSPEQIAKVTDATAKLKAADDALAAQVAANQPKP